ncbi:MAG: S49 family peptidase [Oceanicaulis sp.]|nr:S49 family peptidase [Oceanicaulis sp.]
MKREPWMVAPDFEKAYLQHLIALATAETSGEEKTPQSYYKVIDANGNRYFSGDNYKNGVAIIEVIGPMIKYGNWWYYGANEWSFFIQKAMQDPNIAGVVIVMDTGGGQVSSLNALDQALEGRTKPVLTLADNALSAGYWLAASTDHIMANDTLSGEFGSIGVLMSWMSYEKYFEKMGIEEVAVYSDLSSDKNKIWMEAQKGNYKLLKEKVLNPLAETFRNHVTTKRTGIDPSAKGVLTGDTFGAEKALDLGMVDSIGNMSKAVKTVLGLSAVYQFNNNQ